MRIKRVCYIDKCLGRERGRKNTKPGIECGRSRKINAEIETRDIEDGQKPNAFMKR